MLKQLNVDSDIATSWHRVPCCHLSPRDRWARRGVPWRCIGIGSQSQSWSGSFSRAGPISALLAAGPPLERHPGLNSLEQRQVFNLAFDCSLP